MNIKQILCPIDFSDFNQSANEYASLLAQSTGAKIIYFHTSLPLATTYGAYGYIDVDEEAERDQQRLEKIKPTIEGIEASHVLRFGSPAVMIVDFAEENDVDLIVMGDTRPDRNATRGHGKRRRSRCSQSQMPGPCNQTRYACSTTGLGLIATF